MTGLRRPTVALGAAVATATVLALAACTPSGPQHPTAATSSPTTTPPGLDPLDPPLDPGPTDPGADPTDVELPALTWPDGSPVAPVPVDPGSARRVDAADLRTVARPSAGAGTELGFLTVGADGTVLVADSTQGVTEDTEHRTERLRLEGPGGVLELSTEPEGSELYLAWILANGGVVGYRTLGLQSSEAELVRFGPGARQAMKLELDGRWPLEEGLLDADGTEVVGGRSGDVHVFDVSSGTLLRVRHSGAVGAVLVAGPFLAWTFGSSDDAGPTRGLVVDVADALHDREGADRRQRRGGLVRERRRAVAARGERKLGLG